MDQRTIQIFFALLRSAIKGTKLNEEQRSNYSSDMLQDMFKLSAQHDVIHLICLGLKQNELVAEDDAVIEKRIFKAAYRYERLKYEYENLCGALEKAHIAFLPLKGSVIRKYYPEEWMRTSCDIDVLVHRDDVEKAIAYLAENFNYVEKERATHDVSLFSPSGVHIELHFDLVEEGRANNAIDVLNSVWDDVSLHKDSECWYEMSDKLFYFYHIAHMAKHFETGGCGIRPFIDLWILDSIECADKTGRDELLEKGGLLRFAEVSRELAEFWFGSGEASSLSLQMQNFILHGGAYGSFHNRVALQQKKKGGRIGYVISRIFIPYSKLKRYYPILEKHPYLMPLMQVKRWFMLFRPDVANMVKSEIVVNNTIDRDTAREMHVFLNEIGL